MDPMWLIGAVLVGVLFLLILTVYTIRDLKTQNKSQAGTILYLNERIEELTKKSERQNNSQRSVLKGKLAEQMFPILAGIKKLFNPYDIRGMGGEPYDFIVFDGLTEAKDNGGEFNRLVLLDVKYGNAVMSPHQKKIKETVNSGIPGSVIAITVRIDDDGNLTVEE